MEEKLKNILNKLKEINYAWVDKYGVVHKRAGKDFFIKNYRLQTIEETLNYKVGTCWEEVELVRYYLEKENIPVKTYIIIYNDDSKIARHTIAVVEYENKFYLMENSWDINEELRIYNSTDEILKMFVELFPKMYKIYDFDIGKIEIYEYSKPTPKMTFEEFTAFCRNGRKIEV